ncbi:hypothetical protein EDC04DRAFT_2629047 [Pisolithus marmoratus]|nr:hypothetical protein EDC04DRAFT_2629047 [Pisolithus marmoratus]
MAEAGKSALSIRLTEPFVFLRTNDPSGHHPPDSADSPGLVRGLVTLNLAKPTRISSIEVELQAVVTTAVTEGIGPRRLDVTDDRTIYSTKTTCFRADDHSFARRTTSVGPGLFLSNANDYDQELHHPGPPTYIPSAGTSTRQTQPIRSVRHGSCDVVTRNREPTPPYTLSAHSALVRPLATVSSSSHVSQPAIPTTPSSASFSSGAGQRDVSLSRRPSSEEASDPLRRLSPIPTRTSLSPERGRGTNSPHSPDTSARRESLTRTSRGRSRFSLTSVLDVVKEVTGTASRSRSRSARTNGNDYLEEIERGRTKVRAAVPPTIHDVDTTQDSSTSQQSPQTSLPHKDHPYSFFGLGRVLGLDNNGDAEDDAGRGRKHKDHGEGWKEFREGTYTYPIVFPLPPHLPPTYKLPWASLSYTLRAIVHRPGAFTSKMTCSKPFIVVSAPAVSTSEGGSGGPGDPGPVAVERVWEGKLGYGIELSGRLFIAGAGDDVSHAPNGYGGGNVGGSVTNLNGATEGDHADLVSLHTANSVETPQARIPADGTVVLGLTLAPLEKVKVWRVSAFIDERVTYLCNGTGSVRDDTLHRMVLWSVEDTQSSHDHERNSMDAPSGKDKGKEMAKAPEPIPILPTPLSPHRSPLVPYLRRGADPSDLIGPGPYNLSTVIAIPGCSDTPKGPLITFSIRHRDAGVRVEHTLRIVIRVERPDENDDDTSDSAGDDIKKRLFDITVQVPVVVLSCGAMEWQTLPRYCEVLDNNAARAHTSCPCDLRGIVAGERQLERPCTTSSGTSSSESGSVVPMSTDMHSTSTASGSGSVLAPPPVSLLHAPTSPTSVTHLPTVMHERSRSRAPARAPSPVSRYERLVSGQESEVGEAPPSYESVAGSAN